jgi:hypothetical protein
MENYHKVACFGFMVTDSSRGRVTIDREGLPQVRYSLNERDRQQMIRGHAILSRVFLAAGAKTVYPGLSAPWNLVCNEADVLRFEREAQRDLRARHINMSAFHPLGTCRMHADPRRGVTSQTGETHQVPNLFICDGSAVPGPLGVNPQMTIMALSERNAKFVLERIEEETPTVLPQHEDTDMKTIEFAETMSGSMSVRGGPEVDVEFEVRAHRNLDDDNDEGITFQLEGVIHVPGIASTAPCVGTLVISPTQRRATLHYELSFEGDDDETYLLRGNKDASLLRMLRSMTTLYTSIWQGSERVAQGVLKFHMRDIPSWLQSWRLRST